MVNRFDLAGRTALVAGSTHIIGPAVCRGLAENGANVVVADIDAKAAEALAADLHARFGVETLHVTMDVADEEQVAAGVAKARDRFGAIDVLVSGAAVKTPGFFEPLESFAWPEWQRIMDVNIGGAFLLAKHVAPGMKDAGRGSIVTIASIYGVSGPDPRIYDGAQWGDKPINTPPAYAASKAGLIGLTRWLATTLAPFGVRANSITPGGVESGQNERFVTNYAKRTPMGRMARADELKGAAVFLASDASSYVTGQNLIVDGGWTAW